MNSPKLDAFSKHGHPKNRQEVTRTDKSRQEPPRTDNKHFYAFSIKILLIRP